MTDRDARVITRAGPTLVIEDRQGVSRPCQARRRAAAAVCGDRVRWVTGADGSCILSEILPRDNQLSRRDRHGRLRTIAANIDQLAVVLAPRPEPQWDLVDRYLIAAADLEARVLLVFNKVDLLEAPVREPPGLRPYIDAGYLALTVSAQRGDGLNRLEGGLAGRTSILVGQSGVGKSALANRLHPNTDTPEGALSANGRWGRHTTTQARLYHLPRGGDLIDSPGVRSFEPPGLSLDRIQAGFPEFFSVSAHCRYHNCTHAGEPGCAVEAAVKRGEIAADRLSRYHALVQGLARD